jgi:hypothetical protein
MMELISMSLGSSHGLFKQLSKIFFKDIMKRYSSNDYQRLAVKTLSRDI